VPGVHRLIQRSSIDLEEPVANWRFDRAIHLLSPLPLETRT